MGSVGFAPDRPHEGIMESVPLHMRSGGCVSSDEELLANIASSLKRGYPEIKEAQPARFDPIVIVGSGPSVAGQLETIRELRARGAAIVAVKDAHDWLIQNGVTPDYGFMVDPQAHRWNCFIRKQSTVTYLISSQCHPAVFNHLADMNVVLWHCYNGTGQRAIKGRMLIGGSTTSGLRSVMVFYVLGYRDFHLFGFDSCLDGEKLRVNGDGLKEGDGMADVMIEPGGEKFMCNPNMALQAHTFQDFYELIPDARFTGYGHGLIQAIIQKRNQQREELDAVAARPNMDNGLVSFIHCGDNTMASYRYRAQIPSNGLGASINDLTASTLVFSKPRPEDLIEIGRAKASGQWVVVDICDDHLDWMHYQEALHWADMVTCPTIEMARRILAARWERKAIIIPDPWEYTLRAPHFQGINLLWFGHAVNKLSLERILPEIEGYPLRVVSNFGGSIPWSRQTMLEEFANADIILMPATEDYKSANRTVEALRQGCFVIAEPHPSLMDIHGIYIGSIKEGLEWVKSQSITEINRRISMAQKYVTEKYSPAILTEMWRSAIQRPTISEVAAPIGTAGSMSIPAMAQT